MPIRFLLAAAMLSAAGAAFAQEPEPPSDAAEAEPSHFEVTGLAPDDELNVRATASATGMLIGRLPLGAMVRNLGCSDVGEYRWCKVGDLNDEKVQGWSPARYLQPADPNPTGDVPAETPGEEAPQE